ncbi:MAG: nuclear transport factor 2 family protein [Burkholderiaceae bacterium]
MNEPLARAAAGARSLALDADGAAAVARLYADYAAALDERRFDDWVTLFVDDCRYTVQPRENHERGLPLATIALEGVGMLRDRIHAIRDTLFHAPYYQRQVIGPPRIRAILDEQGGRAVRVSVEANYAVFRTHLHQPTDLLSVGRHLDELVRTGGDWSFALKHVVFDTELIPNSLIYPI